MPGGGLPLMARERPGLPGRADPRRRERLARWLALVASMACAVAGAQSGGDFAVRRSVIANGGGTGAGAGFEIASTAGQGVAGTVSTGGPFQVRAGFVAAVAAPASDPLFANGFE